MRLLAWLWISLIAVIGCAPAMAATTAFTGATVIDGTGAAAIPDGVVLVSDGRIAAVGPRAQVSIPADAEIVAVTGKVIIPGLVNAHGHVQGAVRQGLVDQLALYARYGVTTVFSLGDDGPASVALRDEQRAAPTALSITRMYVAGPVLNVRDAESGRAAVDRNAALKVDIIKIRAEGAGNIPAAFGPMIAQAHADGLRTAAHMFSENEAEGLVAADIDVLAHSIRDQDVSPAMIAAMKTKGVGYIPTLTRDLSAFVYESIPAFAADPFFTREAAYRATFADLTRPEAMAQMRASASAQAIKPALAQANRNLKALSDAGVAIAMGTDSGAFPSRFQGYFEHLELAMMVEARLSPAQALYAATGGAAKVMHIDDAVGTLQPGRFADLLVLGANPLDSIANTKTLEQVWIGGRKVN